MGLKDFRTKSLRGLRGDGSPEAEGTLGPLPGLSSGVRVSSSGLGHGARGRRAGAEKGESGKSAKSKLDLQSNSGLEEKKLSSAYGEFKESSSKIEKRAQPSESDGVEEGMASLVLDNTSMGSKEMAARAAARAAALAETGDGPNELSDAAIMLRVAAGDDSCFNFLVEKHHRAVIHFLTRMVHNQAVAEELAQEVFLRVYRSRESYRAEAKFTTWLYRIATNLGVNHARDTKHERTAQTVYLDQPDPETGTTPDVADDELTVDDVMLRDERMAAIREHVMALPERQRMAVLMHKYQEMDYREIGEVLKLSESATKSLLFRAYQTLRENLKAFV